MSTYSFTEQELIIFAKKLYKEGFSGYLDLMDSVAESAVSRVISEKENVIAKQSISNYNNGSYSYVDMPMIWPDDSPVRRETFVR